MSPLLVAFLLLITMASATPLRPGFYSQTCPEAESIVRDEMRKAMINEPRSGASVMRFQFHDCLVNVKNLIQIRNSVYVFSFLL